MDKDAIRSHVDALRENIEASVQKAERNPQDITLMAVSKTYPIEYVQYAREVCGITCFGENRAQEIVQKYQEYRIERELHMIGHLQSNKIAKVLPFVRSIDSVDSLKLLEKLSTAAEGRTEPLEVLLEFNTSQEEAKSGFLLEDELLAAVERGLELDNIEMKGVMTVGPLTDDEKQVREAFSTLRELYYRVIKAYPEVLFTTISMGMTGDYSHAIEEGATMIRIGSGIFGERDYG